MISAILLTCPRLRLYLVSCLLALGSSFCVGRWIQTARQKQSVLAPNKLLCLDTSRPGKTLSADQESSSEYPICSVKAAC